MDLKPFLLQKDTDVPLQTRVKRANNADADAYVSIHYNALTESLMDMTQKDFQSINKGSVENWPKQFLNI